MFFCCCFVLLCKTYRVWTSRRWQSSPVLVGDPTLYCHPDSHSWLSNVRWPTHGTPFPSTCLPLLPSNLVLSTSPASCSSPFSHVHTQVTLSTLLNKGTSMPWWTIACPLILYSYTCMYNVHKGLNSEEGYSISTQWYTVAVFFTFSTKQTPVTVCSRVTSEPASILKVTGLSFVMLTQIVREEMHSMHQQVL